MLRLLVSLTLSLSFLSFEDRRFIYYYFSRPIFIEFSSRKKRRISIERVIKIVENFGYHSFEEFNYQS